MTHKLTCLRPRVRVLSALFLLCALLLAIPAAHATTPPTILMSQIMGAGGNGTNPYTADYVELFNYGSSSVTLTGWSLQYASATGTSTSSNLFAIPTVTIPAGGYYLVSGAVTANGGTTDPSDLSTGMTLSGTSGRVFLVDTQTALVSASIATPSSDATIIDMVGYGSPNSYEGAGPSPAPSSSANSYIQYMQRTDICANAYSNSAEWALQSIPTPGTTPSTNTDPVGASAPHNSHSTVTVCVHTIPASASNPVATPSTVKVGSNTLLTVQVIPGSNPTSTGIAVKADLSVFGLGTAVAFNDAGTGGDATAGDGIYSYTLSVPGSQALNSYNINVTVTDTQGDSIATQVISLSTAALSSTSTVLSIAPNPPVPNQSTVLTATITPNAGIGGTVTFKDAGVQLGNTTPSVNGSGVAFLTLPSGLSPGVHTLSAVYSGDSNYTTSTGSLLVSANVPPVPDFTLSLSNSQVITSGQDRNVAAASASPSVRSSRCSVWSSVLC